MRHVVCWFNLVLASTFVYNVSAAYGELPACAVSCYGPSAPTSETIDCNFGNNDCTCQSGSNSSTVEQCILASCSVKQWLVSRNATDTICNRPIRDRHHVLLYSSTICGSFALLAVFMRLFVAIRQNTFGYDDLCAGLASAMAVPNFIGLANSSKLGIGRDIWTLTPEEINKCLRQIYICQNFYFWCTGFTKLCFLFFFLRIFPSVNARRWCFVGIALSIGYAAGFGFPMTFACWPIPAIWTAWDMEHAPPQYCINQNLFYYCAAAVNIATDVMIALIPIPELWKLNLSFKRKILLSSIFGVGFLTILVSCLRVQSLTQYASTTNPTYDTLSSGTWSVIELNVGVICICMPAFRRFLAHTLPGCFSMPSSDYDQEDQTPTMPSIGVKKRSKMKDTLPQSLFDTNITKTIDTRVETSKPEDDEVQLVDMSAKESNNGTINSTEDGHSRESIYKSQHRDAIPSEWDSKPQ